MDFIPHRPRELAHLVLPAAIWGEKEGTYTNSERRVSKVNRAVDPPGEAKSDFDIFLGAGGEAWLPGRIVSRMERSREMPSKNGSACRRGRLCDYSGLTYELIEQHDGIQWPFRKERPK